MIKNAIILNYLNRDGGSPAYQSFATIPTKGTTEVFTYGSQGAYITEGKLNGKTDIELSGDYLRLDFAGFAGSELTPIRVFCEASSGVVMGGDSLGAGNKVITAERDGNDWFEFYDFHIIGNSNPATTGIIGLNVGSSDDGSNFKFVNGVIKDTSAAGAQFNVVRASQHYESIYFEDVRMFNTGKENWYMNTTAKPPSSYNSMNNLRIKNCLGYMGGWDGSQANSCYKTGGSFGVWISYMTIYGAGVLVEGGQWFNFQYQNCNGLVEHSIFDSSENSGIIAVHDFVFDNCFFNFTTDAPIQIQKLTTQYSGAEAANNLPIKFTNCVFKGTLTDLFDVNEDECDIQLIDCTLSDGIGNIFNDNRTDKVTYSLTNTGGNVVADASLPSPTYNNWDADEKNTHGLVTSQYHLNMGVGYRSPIV